MRSIRVTTGLLLIAAIGVVLLAAALYTEAVLSAQVRYDTLDALRAEARLIEEAADAIGDDPFTLARQTAMLTGRRVTIFDPEGQVLAETIPSAQQPAGRPSTTDLWRVIETNRRHDDLFHAVATLDEGAIVLLTASPHPAAEARGSLRSFFIGAFLALALLAGIVAARAWSSIDLSLHRISTVAERLGGGDLSARLREGHEGALGGLERSLNTAIDRIGERLVDAREQGRYYAAILDQMTDAVVAVDDRGHVQFVNRQFSRLFDVEPDAAVGQPVENVVLHYEVGVLVTRSLEQNSLQRSRLRLSHPDENVLEAVATPLTDDAGDTVGAVGLLHDITQLQEATKVRQDFVANASHELRTPAASIKALAEALQSGAMRDPEHGTKFCAQIVEAADRLTEILDDMLTLSRVERGAQLLEPRAIDAASALEDAVRQVRPAADRKGISVNVEAGDRDTVHADPASLQTLLLNLLDNAVKYTPEGGTVTARGRPTPGGYEIEVADTGIGIPEADRQRIFERFYRVDRARDRKTGSTGLGLSIVKHIAEAHGGRVGVSSREGEGSRFRAVFPSPAR